MRANAKSIRNINSIIISTLLFKSQFSAIRENNTKIETTKQNNNNNKLFADRMGKKKDQ